MKDNDKLPILEQQDIQKLSASERRKAVKNILAGAAVGGAAATSKTWVKPVVDAVVMPAHAQTSSAVTGQAVTSCLMCGSIAAGYGVIGSVSPAQAGVSVTVTISASRTGTVSGGPGGTITDTLITGEVRTATTNVNGEFVTSPPVDLSTPASAATVVAGTTLAGSLFARTSPAPLITVLFTGGYRVQGDIALSSAPGIIAASCANTSGLLSLAPCIITV